MIGWIFIVSVLAVLVYHYLFVGHTNHARPNVDLQIQKYKTIIDKLSQPQEDLLSKHLSYESMLPKDMSEENTSSSDLKDMSSSDLEDMSSSDLEDLETYVQSKTAF
jgi:hypothetical protein